MPGLFGPLARVEAGRITGPGAEHAKHVRVFAAREPPRTVAHREHDAARHERSRRVPHREPERGDEEEPPTLHTQDRERTVQRRIAGPAPPDPSSEEPRQEVRRAHRHPETEDDPGQRALAPALAEREHQPAHHDCDQRQPPRDRARELGLEFIDRNPPTGSSPAPTAPRGTATTAWAQAAARAVLMKGCIVCSLVSVECVAHSASPRLATIRLRIHSSTSDSIQPTARAPSDSGLGKLPRPVADRSCSATALCGLALGETEGCGRGRPLPGSTARVIAPSLLPSRKNPRGSRCRLNREPRAQPPLVGLHERQNPVHGRQPRRTAAPHVSATSDRRSPAHRNSDGVSCVRRRNSAIRCSNCFVRLSIPVHQTICW